MIAKTATDSFGTDYLEWWCPGCDDMHVIPVNASGAWDFDGNVDSPTVSPSILVQPIRTLINVELQEPARTNEAHICTTPLCHSFVKAGHIQFLADCTHHLLEQTIPMGPIPEGWS